MNVNIKIHDPRLLERMPAYATPGSAGLDLNACIQEPLVVKAGETVMIPAGFAMQMDEDNFAALILPRSGLGHKSGIVLGNLVGLIDSDFINQLGISLWNRSRNDFTVNPMDRVAQLVIVPVVQARFTVVEELRNTERGLGGFGSTGSGAIKSS